MSEYPHMRKVNRPSGQNLPTDQPMVRTHERARGALLGPVRVRASGSPVTTGARPRAGTRAPVHGPAAVAWRVVPRDLDGRGAIPQFVATRATIGEATEHGPAATVPCRAHEQHPQQGASSHVLRTLTGE